MTATESARAFAARLANHHRAERYAYVRQAIAFRRVLRTARRERLMESDTAAAVRWFLQRARTNAAHMRALERRERRESRRAA